MIRNGTPSGVWDTLYSQHDRLFADKVRKSTPLAVTIRKRHFACSRCCLDTCVHVIVPHTLHLHVSQVMTEADWERRRKATHRHRLQPVTL